MTKRVSRTAIALAAIGVLASPAVSGTANAQVTNSQIPINTSARFVGPIPSGVTGVSVNVSCFDVTGVAGTANQTLTASFGTQGGTTALNFGLNPANASTGAKGSSCQVTATIAGTANTTVGGIAISVGGAARAVSQTGAVGTTAVLPVWSASEILVTVSYAQITVRKVVNGEEPVPGFAYPMTVSCVTPSNAQTFIDIASNGNIGAGLVVAGGAGNFLSVPVTGPAAGPFIATAGGILYTHTVRDTPTGGTRTLTSASATPTLNANEVIIATTSVLVPPTEPATYDRGTAPYGVSAPAALAAANPVAAASAGGGLVVPGGGFVTVTLSNINRPYIATTDPDGAGPYVAGDLVAGGAGFWVTVTDTTVTPAKIFSVFDARTTGALAAPDVLGNTAGIGSLSASEQAALNARLIALPDPAPTVTTFRVYDELTDVRTIPAGGILGNDDNLEALVSGGGVTAQLGYFVNRAIAALAGNSVTSQVRVYDYRTVPSTIPAGGLLGTAANLNQNVTSSGVTKPLATWINEILAAANPILPIAPVNIALKGGDTRALSFNEFPNLRANSQCVVRETNSQGSALAYSSSVTNADGTAGTPRPGETVNGAFVSALTNMNETVTVTNSFYGDLIVSKVVTGDPKSNIATYEISVSCDQGGPKDTFLLKDRQSKVYNNIKSGTNCLITETKSDGAVSSTVDNSGDNVTDGRVVIKRRPTSCGVALINGAPTLAVPGGPAPTTSFDECFANVIITNDYNPPATTAAPASSAPAAAPATAAPATAAPAVEPAPAVAVEATPTFTG